MLRTALQKLFGGCSPTPRRDPEAWALAQAKKETERRLRAAGHSRKQAQIIASQIHRKQQ